MTPGIIRLLFRGIELRLNTGRRARSVRFPAFTACLLLLASFFSLSCNQPFQPVVNYKPELVMYSILFADQTGVYVRLSSTSNSLKDDVTQPVHAANVGLVMSSYRLNPGDSAYSATFDTISLKESFALSAGDTDYYYYASVPTYSGTTYGITAEKEGYTPVSAYVTVPYSHMTTPDADSYAALRKPDGSNVDPVFSIMLGGSSAYFVQLSIEYRGFDDAGNFRAGFVDATGSSPTDPFIQIKSNYISYDVNRSYYAARLSNAKAIAGYLKQSHLYVDIIVTQINDPLYRFYITSGRWSNPLAMRTDKVVFSNVTNGDGIVGAAAVDTTRIFLF